MRCYRSFTLTLLLLILVLSLTLGLDRGLAAAGVDLRVDWSMADRYGLDADGDGVVDAHDTAAEVQPSSWVVQIDACASTTLDPGDSIAAFEVEVDGSRAGRFTECSFSLELSSEGSHAVAVTAITSSGDRTTVDLDVTVRDWLIVGLGDSYASGEGVPDVAVPADGLDRALAAYDAVDEALQRAEELRQELEDLESALESAAARVRVTRDALDAAAATVASRLGALNRAKDELTSVEADVRPVNDALAAWRRDCVDSFHLIRCPIATGALVAALVDFGVSAAEELITEGYAAIKRLIDGAVDAARSVVSAAQTAYDQAIAARDSARAALDAALAAVEDLRDLLNAVTAALAAAQGAIVERQAILDRINSEVRAIWQDESCHRSAFSSQAQAALELERRDPRSSVTFVHLACSGATTSGVIDQVAELRELVGEREIDAVVVSVGGNDAGFGKIIQSLIKHGSPTGVDVDVDALAAVGGLCPFVPGLSDACESLVDGFPDRSAADILESGLSRLPAGYAALAERLAGIVEPDRVFLTEYPDATRREGGEYCGPLAVPGISAEEWRWADQVATARINDAVVDAAAEHGWNLVDGLHDLFRGHGYCADAHWMVRFEESVLVQGDFNGTAHPNADGHEALGGEIAEVVGASLDLDPLIPFLRGDCNADGVVDISDASKTLGILFLGDGEAPCGDACDSNDDGTNDISDAIATLGVLFLGTGTIPAPGITSCGVDPTDDQIGCDAYGACR